MTEHQSRTSLTRFAEIMNDPDPAAARRFANQVYDEHEVLMILPSDVTRGLISQMIVDAIVRLLYPNGRRR